VQEYVDMPGSPLFPFGHGLSYTKFEYSNLKISPAWIGPWGVVQVSVDVQNTGQRQGAETVQLYVNDLVSSVTRPLQELKGFEKIVLQAGEKMTVRFKLGPEELSFLDRNLESVVEPGTFRVMVGSSCDDIRLGGNFEVKQ
jgi:beta-glucosidase